MDESDRHISKTLFLNFCKLKLDLIFFSRFHLFMLLFEENLYEAYLYTWDGLLFWQHIAMLYY